MGIYNQNCVNSPPINRAFLLSPEEHSKSGDDCITIPCRPSSRWNLSFLKKYLREDYCAINFSLEVLQSVHNTELIAVQINTHFPQIPDPFVQRNRVCIIKSKCHSVFRKFLTIWETMKRRYRSVLQSRARLDEDELSTLIACWIILKTTSAPETIAWLRWESIHCL